MAIKDTSNLRATPIKNSVLQEYIPAITVDLTQSVTISLRQHHTFRPDILAYELYGNSEYWWVFTLFNRDTIVNPIKDFVSGMTINVPTKSFISGI
jgi:hypothetical protein